VRSDEELQELGARPVFDLDTYRILARYFDQPHHHRQVVEIAA
jgi:hypothetical protein